MKLLYLLLLPFLFFFVFVPFSLAANVSVEGKLVDQNNNPIPQGSVIFLDASGKTVVAAVSDFSGKYKTPIATGTYTVKVSGPQGSKMEAKTLPDHRIEQSVTLDFTLDAPKADEAKKPSFVERILPWGIGGGILLVVISSLFILWRKKPSAKSGGSD